MFSVIKNHKKANNHYPAYLTVLAKVLEEVGGTADVGSSSYIDSMEEGGVSADIRSLAGA